MTTTAIGMATTIIAGPLIASQLNGWTKGKSSLSTSNHTISTTNGKYCTTSCGDFRMFHGMLALFFVNGIFNGIIGVLLDSNTMEAIEVHTKEASFGKQRVFGAVAFFFGSLIAGATTAGVLLLVGLPFYLFVVVQIEKRYKELDNGKNSTSNKTIGENKERLPGLKLVKLSIKTCFKPYNLFILSRSFLQGIFMFILYSFLFLHMEQQMNASVSMIGLSAVAANIGEVFIFPLSKSILERFGKENCFLLSLLSTGVRCILLGICTNAWLILPIQLLHSISYGLFYTAMFELLTLISPKEIFSALCLV